MKKLLTILLLALSAHAGTVTGAVQTSSGGAVANGTLTFTLTQSAVVSGTATIVTSPVSCYTDANGNVRGLPTPAVSTTSTNLASGSLPAGTYYVRATWANATGETFPSSEQIASLTGAGTLIVTPPASKPASATIFNVYISATAGTETKQGSVAISGGSFAAYQQSVALVSGAALPASNTSACSIRFNDELQPSYTGYNVGLANSSGSPIAGYPQKWYLSGGASGTVNVSVGTPLYAGVVQYPQAIISTPAANSSQSISGPLDLGIYGLNAGSIAATVINNIRYALSDGWACDNSTDDSAAFIASLAAISGAGGGVLKLPPNKTCKIAGQITIPNDGASPPHQQSIKIEGGIGGGLEQGYTQACNGGTVLNMTFNSSTGKIDTRGLGKLEITGICFTDSNTDGSPFVFTTNTNVQAHDNQFRGNPSAVNDIFILGGTNACCAVDGTAGSMFQGYGTNIHHNQADYCKRFALLQNEANAVHINNNDIFVHCANVTGGAIELNPGANPATQLIAGSDVSFNLIEMFGYKYGVYLVQNAAGNQIYSNECFDNGASSVNCVKIATGAANNSNQVLDADATGVLPPAVDVNNSTQSSGLFQGATGSATTPTFSWSGFGSNPPGWFRLSGSAVAMAGAGAAQFVFDYDAAGQLKARGDVGQYCFAPAADLTVAADTCIQRDVPGITKFISGTNTAGFSITATLFANLGTPANGTFKYCSDCMIANPCANGGTGALAKRLNGAWVCN